MIAVLLFGWLLLKHIDSEKRVRQLIDLIVATGAASALFGLLRHAVQHSPGFGLARLQPNYGYGQFVNANHFAFLMEMALGLALGLIVCRGVKGTRAVVYFLAATPMWIALVLSGSRGGILSLLCEVLVLALIFSSARPVYEPAEKPNNFLARLNKVSRTVAVRVLLMAGVLAAAITVVVLVGGDPLTGRVDSLAVELDRNVANTYTLRPNIWRATWRMIKEHPVAGTGFGGYWIAITKYHEGSGETTPQEAHNDYLELLSSGGVIGVLIAVWFVIEFLRLVRRKLHRARIHEESSFERAATFAALTAIIAVAVHSLVDFGLHLTVNAVVFVALLIIAINGAGKKGNRMAAAAAN
jgi:O-antigen ligase